MTAGERTGAARLIEGQELNQPEFHRRYLASPDLKKAELIEGMVCLESPVRYRAHSRPQTDLLLWLNTYALGTPGTVALGNVTLILDNRNELEPDAVLFISPDRGGQCRVDPDDYLHGGPELVAEVSASTAARDYGMKKAVYLRHHVRELIIWRTEDAVLDWFVLHHDRYELLHPEAGDLLRSRMFPGLWLDSTSLLAGRMSTVLEQLRRGLDSAGHQCFVAGLQESTG